MPAHETAMNADQERALIVLLSILCCWRDVPRVETNGFHQTVEYLLPLLEEVRPGTIARLDLTTARIKHLLSVAAGLDILKEETVKDVSMLVIHTRAGPRIHQMTKDLCQDIAERDAIRRLCEEARKWYRQQVS